MILSDFSGGRPCWILHRVGSGQDKLPAPLPEILADIDRLAGLVMRFATGKGAAIATIQKQRLAPRVAIIHQIVQQSRRNRSRPKKLAVGVGGGKVKPSHFILEAVAGKIEQQQIVLGTAGEERFDFSVNSIR